ncbi:MAG: YlxR family protein [Solirubrobacteraceae bacterium]
MPERRPARLALLRARRPPGARGQGHRRRRAGLTRDPERTCVGCRRHSPQSALHRFANVSGEVVPDPERRLPGRGAWLHPDLACFDRAQSGRGFNRALRAPVTIPKDTVDFTRTWPRNASTS